MSLAQVVAAAIFSFVITNNDIHRNVRFFALFLALLP